MCNTVHLVRTQFTDINCGATGYGWRIFDNYARSYMNLFDSPDDIPSDDMEFLRSVKSHDSAVEEILDSVEREKTGIEIDDNWYEYEDIRHILEEGRQ